MADIILFKSPQMKDDAFSEVERLLKGEARLAGVPAELIDATMARTRRIYERCIEKKLDVSVSYTPIVRLTAEESVALKTQIESLLTQELHSKYITHFLMTAMVEIGKAEAELYIARKGEIG